MLQRRQDQFVTPLCGSPVHHLQHALGGCFRRCPQRQARKQPAQDVYKRQVVVLSILLVFGYFFSTIANWIAAPFSGLLAEQLEARLTGATPPDVGVFGIMKDIPRIMKREWQKLAWYLPRAIVLLLLYFIPGVGQTVAPVLWFLFSAWMLAIQYCDYPFDNHKVPFRTMREALRSRKVMNMQFGALTSLFTMIPVLNLVILPVAICGATAMSVSYTHLREFNIPGICRTFGKHHVDHLRDHVACPANHHLVADFQA